MGQHNYNFKLACDLTLYILYESLTNDVNPQNLSNWPGGPIDPGQWPSFWFLLHAPLLAIFIPWNIHSYTFTDHHFKHFEIECGALLGCHFYHYKITKGSIQQPSSVCNASQNFSIVQTCLSAELLWRIVYLQYLILFRQKLYILREMRIRKRKSRIYMCVVL